MKLAIRFFTITLCLCLQLSAQSPQPSYNILFFGNSYTAATGGDKEAKTLNGIPGIVQQIAIAAGHEAPQVQKTWKGGKNLQWHYNNRQQTIVEPTDLVPVADDFQWDFVVFQEFSTGATDAKIDHKQSAQPERFLEYSQKLFLEVERHSSEVKAVFYMTWARHPEKPGFYPTPFADPSDFQSQVRNYYHQAAAALNQEAPRASVAPAGDAWEALGFPRYLYAADLYHASNQGSLLNSLIIYRTIYGTKTAKLDLTKLARKLKISKHDLQRLTATADSIEIHPL